MKQQTQVVAMPSANLTINKGRLPIYNKTGEMPTYYLTKGQEFQIEIFNPTADIILAKIKLNNKSISQGGLVLKPGERVFLERYLDVAKKFLFDTYEVSGGSEAQKAIEQNGDFSVEFYKERQSQITLINGGGMNGGSWHTGPNTLGGPNIRTFTTNNSQTLGNYNVNDIIGATNYSDNLTTTSGMATMDSMLASDSLIPDMDMSFMDVNLARSVAPPIEPEKATRSFNKGFPNLKRKRVKKSKSVETGRVEQGAHSNQTIKQVNYDFEYSPFHTLEYKLLPQSQKVNTSNDVKTRKYCVDCGKKQAPTNKFCANCGKKQ